MVATRSTSRKGRSGRETESSSLLSEHDASRSTALNATRLEPPSTRQQLQYQHGPEGPEGRHASLLRNATIKEFLEDYPREEWPAVLENIVLLGLRGLYSNVPPGHLRGLSDLEQVTERARREVAVMSPPRRAFGQGRREEEEEEGKGESGHVVEQEGDSGEEESEAEAEAEAEEEEPSASFISAPSPPSRLQQPRGRPPRAPSAAPPPQRRGRKDALFHYPFVDSEGHVEELLGGQPGVVVGGAERCFYDLDRREQERRARKVFEEMRRGVGGLRRQDLAYTLRLVGVPLSDREARRLLPALYEAGPDDAALPISYPQWLALLRALRRCFCPSTTEDEHGADDAALLSSFFYHPQAQQQPQPSQEPQRAPGQPSPIDTLGLGLIGESISTIKIPSRRSHVGAGTGETATGGRIRPERARQEADAAEAAAAQRGGKRGRGRFRGGHDQSAFHSSSTDNNGGNGGGGTASFSSSSSSSSAASASFYSEDDDEDADASTGGLRAVAGAAGYEPLPSVRHRGSSLGLGVGGIGIEEGDSSSTPLRAHEHNPPRRQGQQQGQGQQGRRQGQTYGTYGTAAAGTTPAAASPTLPRHLRDVQSRIKPQLDTHRRALIKERRGRGGQRTPQQEQEEEEQEAPPAPAAAQLLEVLAKARERRTGTTAAAAPTTTTDFAASSTQFSASAASSAPGDIAAAFLSGPLGAQFRASGGHSLASSGSFSGSEEEDEESDYSSSYDEESDA